MLNSFLERTYVTIKLDILSQKEYLRQTPPMSLNVQGVKLNPKVMKKSILHVGEALTKAQLQQVNGGFAPCNDPSDCATIYNRTAFEPLPDSAFSCWAGWCDFAS